MFYNEDGDRLSLDELKKEIVASTEDDFLKEIEDYIDYIMDGYYAGARKDIIDAIRIRLASERDKGALWD